MAGTLFPTDLPGSRWTRFRAEGFPDPVCGVIYRLSRPATCGMPLGGLDTGCIDLETSGMWGYSTIFNTHVPRMGPLNLPFLGISTGGTTWVLCDPTQIKPYSILQTFGKPWKSPLDPMYGGEFSFESVRTPREIHYWGHYPVADLEYETDAPIGVGLRAWASFLPGHIEDSMIPAAVFEVHLRNRSDAYQEGSVAFSFPGPTELEAGEGMVTRQMIHGSFDGIYIGCPKASYALGTIAPERPRVGGGIGTDEEAWANIGSELPEMPRGGYTQCRSGEVGGDLGASAARDFDLSPDEQRVVRFLLAWHGPRWRGGGYNWSERGQEYTHMYARHIPTAVHAAFRLSEDHGTILNRVLAWQREIYTDPNVPHWLQDVLVNNLHLLTEVGMWAQARPPIGDWCRSEDGLWGLNECPRGCPQMECGGNTYYGGMAQQYFFPQLVESTLRASKAYQFPDGCPTWIFGGRTGGTPPIDLVEPMRGYQTGQNGSWYVGMVARHWLRTGDDDFLREFYPSVKRTTLFTFNLNPDRPYGLISLPEFDMQESYESTPFKGMSSHVGSIRLYHLKMVEKMAGAVGDAEFARQCGEWFEQASELMEDNLWAGSYYLQTRDPESGEVKDVVMGYQLDGEFMACHDGLPDGVFPPGRVGVVLETLERVADGRWGLRTWSSPGGGPLKTGEFDPGYWSPDGVHAPGALMMAMACMYRGRREYGLDLARRIMENMVCRQRWTWDMPILYMADTGEGIWGNDYAQMMMCWALPAALEGTNLRTLSEPGGFVDRIIGAGSRKVR